MVLIKKFPAITKPISTWVKKSKFTNVKCSNIVKISNSKARKSNSILAF